MENPKIVGILNAYGENQARLVRDMRELLGMDSSLPNTAVHYRLRACEARTRAAAMYAGAVRRAALLKDAEMWERMADYEDQSRPSTGPT